MTNARNYVLARTSKRVIELEAAIRKHRDERGDDRCWLSDLELYKALPEGLNGADLRLHEPREMIVNCMRFILSRQDPRFDYVSPQRDIEDLRARLANASRLADALLTVKRHIDTAGAGDALALTDAHLNPVWSALEGFLADTPAVQE